MTLNSLSSALPTLSLIMAATLWGLLWLPLRALDGAGLNGLWTTVIAYASAMVVALPWLRRWGPVMVRHPGYYIALALASGWCNLAFILAMLEGAVVRVLILFYLSPIWTVLFGFVLLRALASQARGEWGRSKTDAWDKASRQVLHDHLRVLAQLFLEDLTITAHPEWGLETFSFKLPIRRDLLDNYAAVWDLGTVADVGFGELAILDASGTADDRVYACLHRRHPDFERRAAEPFFTTLMSPGEHA